MLEKLLDAVSKTHNVLGIIAMGTEYCESAIEVGRLAAGRGVRVELRFINPYLSFDARREKYNYWVADVLSRTADLPDAGKLRVWFYDEIDLYAKINMWYMNYRRYLMHIEKKYAAARGQELYRLAAEYELAVATNGGTIKPSFKAIPITIAGFVRPSDDGGDLLRGYSLQDFGLTADNRKLPFTPAENQTSHLGGEIYPDKPSVGLVAFWHYDRAIPQHDDWR
ncbi:MAG: hypothetical protein D6712_21045 [Chloroflexi bacterium]|nr:MAG: hypothetical protein D6712_21045 [Chloroflexota bacterium]